jgi:ATP-binding cassette subfamily B (MDR/TAP) protein 1
MGDGVVLEHGTHDELLARDCAYASLVRSQKLRETEPVRADGSSDILEGPDALEDLARAEVPLGRRTTGRSLTSQILEERNMLGEGEHERYYSLVYLFMRMVEINREDWWQYLVGSIAAASTLLDLSNPDYPDPIIFTVSGMLYPAFGVIFAKGVEGFSNPDSSERRFLGDRNALWYVYSWCVLQAH